MTTSGHELGALTGAYAVDALDDAERAAFEAHLATCADCAAEVRGLRAAAGELTHTASLEPPPQLRADLLGAIGAIRPLPPVGDTVVGMRARPARRWLWQCVAAACVVLAAAGGVFGYQQHQDAQRAHDRVSAIAGLLGNPGAATVTGSVANTGHATIVYSRAEHRMVLVGHGIPTPPSDRTYQLWMINAAGRATAAGLFRPNHHGDILIRRSGILPGTTQIGVSVEPAGGSTQPTAGAIVADIRL